MPRTRADARPDLAERVKEKVRSSLGSRLGRRVYSYCRAVRNALGAAAPPMDLPGQISACNRRIEVVRAFLDETNAAGNKSIEAERQIALEAELLHMLEAQLAADTRLKLRCRIDTP